MTGNEKWHVCSDPGPRSMNQDSAFAGLVQNAAGVDTVVLCVADGVGGGEHGEKASRLAVEAVQDLIREHSFTRLSELELDLVGKGLNELNEAIQRLADQDESVNTTLTLCFILGDESLLFHVGDSRLYVVDDQGCRQFTKDHTVLQEVLDQGGDEDAVDTRVGRALARYLGTGGAADVDVARNFMPPDRPCWLVLTSDGVHGCMDSTTLLRLCGAGGSAQQVALRLVQSALEAPTKDNATAVVYRSGPSVPVKTLTSPPAAKRDTEKSDRAPLVRVLNASAAASDKNRVRWKMCAVTSVAALLSVAGFWLLERGRRPPGPKPIAPPVVIPPDTNVPPHTTSQTNKWGAAAPKLMVLSSKSAEADPQSKKEQNPAEGAQPTPERKSESPRKVDVGGASPGTGKAPQNDKDSSAVKDEAHATDEQTREAEGENGWDLVEVEIEEGGMLMASINKTVAKWAKEERKGAAINKIKRVEELIKIADESLNKELEAGSFHFDKVKRGEKFIVKVDVQAGQCMSLGRKK